MNSKKKSVGILIFISSSIGFLIGSLVGFYLALTNETRRWNDFSRQYIEISRDLQDGSSIESVMDKHGRVISRFEDGVVYVYAGGGGAVEFPIFINENSEEF